MFFVRTFSFLQLFSLLLAGSIAFSASSTFVCRSAQRADLVAAVARQNFEETLARILPETVQSADELLPVLRFAIKTSDFWRSQAREAQTATEYGHILNYFDIKTLALLNRGIVVKEIPDLEYVKKSTRENAKRRQGLDVSKIASVKDFLKAASQLLGRKVSFRDHDVIMTTEEVVENNHL